MNSLQEDFDYCPFCGKKLHKIRGDVNIMLVGDSGQGKPDITDIFRKIIIGSEL